MILAIALVFAVISVLLLILENVLIALAVDAVLGLLLFFRVRRPFGTEPQRLSAYTLSVRG